MRLITWLSQRLGWYIGRHAADYDVEWVGATAADGIGVIPTQVSAELMTDVEQIAAAHDEFGVVELALSAGLADVFERALFELEMGARFTAMVLTEQSADTGDGVVFTPWSREDYAISLTGSDWAAQRETAAAPLDHTGSFSVADLLELLDAEEVLA